jgi:hypothetical protein
LGLRREYCEPRRRMILPRITKFAARSGVGPMMQLHILRTVSDQRHVHTNADNIIEHTGSRKDLGGRVCSWTIVLRSILVFRGRRRMRLWVSCTTDGTQQPERHEGLHRVKLTILKIERRERTSRKEEETHKDCAYIPRRDVVVWRVQDGVKGCWDVSATAECVESF